jgi:hypothetical protein
MNVRIILFRDCLIYETINSCLKIFWILITTFLGQNVDGPETPTMPVKFTHE